MMTTWPKGLWRKTLMMRRPCVTNSPRRLDHLDAYTTAVLEKDNIPIDALDRLSSVLQLAAYQVDSRDVPSVLALIDKAEQSRKQTLNGETGAGGEDRSADLRAQWDRLSKVDTDV